MTSEYVPGVWCVAGVVGPLDVRVVSLRDATSYKVGITTTPQRIFPGALADLLVQNLASYPIEIGSTPGLTYGVAIRIPAMSQWSLLGGAVPIGAVSSDVGLTRPLPHDRRPTVSIGTSEDEFAGAAGETNRITYTVPTGKLAYILTQLAAIGIRVAVGAPSWCRAYGNNAGAKAAFAEIFSGAAGAHDSQIVSTVGALTAGLTAICASGSLQGAGGTIRASVAQTIQEFDA